MKSPVFLGCFVLCIWAQNSLALYQGKDMEKSFAKCAEELKLTKEDMEKLKKKEDLSNVKFKCLAKCFCEKEGLISKDGKFSKEGAKAVAMNVYKNKTENIPKAEAVAEECELKLKDLPTTCEAGAAVLECLIEGAKAKEIMPDIKEA